MTAATGNWCLTRLAPFRRRADFSSFVDFSCDLVNRIPRTRTIHETHEPARMAEFRFRVQALACHVQAHRVNRSDDLTLFCGPAFYGCHISSAVGSRNSSEEGSVTMVTSLSLAIARIGRPSVFGEVCRTTSYGPVVICVTNVFTPITKSVPTKLPSAISSASSCGIVASDAFAPCNSIGFRSTPILYCPGALTPSRHLLTDPYVSRNSCLKDLARPSL